MPAVNTSSPDRKLIASSARCMAAVQEFTATALRAPSKAANSASNCRVLAPVASHPERIAAATSAISVSCVSRRTKGRKVGRVID
jgi:hypothetical protein